MVSMHGFYKAWKPSEQHETLRQAPVGKQEKSKLERSPNSVSILKGSYGRS